MDEFEILLRLALIKHLYENDADVRPRVKRLMAIAAPSIRPGLAVIYLSRAPRLVIQRAIDKWCEL